MSGFDRERWLNIASYEQSPEDAQAVVDLSSEITFPWMNIWPRNIDHNMSNLSQPWIDIEYGEWSGPCIVCGAGPSLSRSIEAVKTAHDMGVPIIAVDRAYKTLKDAGIKPTLTVSCDAQEKVKFFFEDVDNDDFFALSIVIHPEVVRRVGWSNVCFHAPANPFSGFWLKTYEKYGEEMATVRSGPVVTFTAVDIALWMGFGKKEDEAAIITIGNELSWETEEEALKELEGTDWKPVLHEATGRYTFQTFLRTADAFSMFPYFNDEVNWLDMSDGILPSGWTCADPVLTERSN